MKRHLFVLFSLVMIASLALAGCAGGTTTAAPTEAPAATEAVTEPTAAVAPAEGETAPATGAEDGTITVATDATFPPFELVDETTKEVTGFDVDLMNAIAEKAGLKVEWVNAGFDPILAGMAQCTYDAAIAAITITPERQAEMLFTDPYISAGQIIVVNKSNTDINSQADLKGKTIGAQLGTTGAIEAGKIEGATVKTYDSYDLAFLDAANGQIDAVIADYPVASGFVAKNPENLKIVGDVFTDESYGIAICKTNTDLQAKLNAALAEVKAEGLIDQLTAKWMTQ